MCGIFGLAGKLGTTSHDKFLKDAAQAGSLRGAHATGAVHVFYDPKNVERQDCNTFKLAVPGWEFVHDKGAKILTTCSNTTAIIGHNRYATGGGMDDEHAHPFVRGSIALVHNGVIDNWRQLLQEASIRPTDVDCTVDSDSVALLLDRTADATSVLEQLDGAFALVWFDARDSSLNFARNTERPMHFLTGDGVFAFGSELGMLQWLAARNDLKLPTVSELHVGVQVKLKHVGAGKLESTVKKFTAKERSRTSWNWAGYDYNSYGYSSSDRAGAWNRTSSGAGAGAGSGNSAQRVNLDGQTYPQATKAIEQLLEAEGMIPGKQHDFVLDKVVQDTGRIVLNLRSMSFPEVRAVKYLYRQLGSRAPGPRDSTEAALVDYVIQNADNIACVTAELSSVIMFTSTDGSTWEDRTTADTYALGAYRYMIATDGMVVYEMAKNGTFVESFNFSARVHDAKKNDFIPGTVMKVAGLSNKTLDNLYNGSPEATIVGPSTDVSCVIVSPVRAPNNRLQVQRANLRTLEA